MPKVLITESYLQDIAAVIRLKLRSDETFYPSEMAEAISHIMGSEVNLEDKIVAENGVYTAWTEGLDGYRRVKVQVIPHENVEFRLKLHTLVGVAGSVTNRRIQTSVQGIIGRAHPSQTAYTGIVGCAVFDEPNAGPPDDEEAGDDNA
jgi:hypothetical protein